MADFALNETNTGINDDEIQRQVNMVQMIKCLFIEARHGLIWFQNVSDVLIGSNEPIMHPNTGCS